MAKSPIDTVFDDAVGKTPGRKASGGDCVYGTFPGMKDNASEEIDAVILENIGSPGKGVDKYGRTDNGD